MTDIIKDEERYIAVVIAAGLSERMRAFKPLLDLGGKAALFRLLDTIFEAGIESVVVVTGFKRTLIEQAVDRYTASCGDGSMNMVNNPDYESGMFSSVKTGINRGAEILKCTASPTDIPRAALLFPVDVPLVSAKTIRDLIKEWESYCASSKHIDSTGLPFAVPIFNGKNGHPLLVPENYFCEILTYKGEGGLKGVRSKYDEFLLRYNTEDEGCVLDMDTPEDYEKLTSFCMVK